MEEQQKMMQPKFFQIERAHSLPKINRHFVTIPNLFGTQLWVQLTHHILELARSSKIFLRQWKRFMKSLLNCSIGLSIFFV